MYYKLCESELKKVQDASSETMTDYQIEGNMIPVDNMMSLIEDLLVELHKRDERISDLESDINNYYELKNTDPYEEYGVSRNDF